MAKGARERYEDKQNKGLRLIAKKIEEGRTNLCCKSDATGIAMMVASLVP